MSSPFTAAELQDLISKLHRLEQWQREREQSPQSQPSQGYTRGDPKARAAASGALVPRLTFPAIPQIAALWKLEEAEVPAFSGEQFRSLDQGPGPLPKICEDQCVFVSWDEREALQRLNVAYSVGFWARVSLETFTDQVTPLEFPELASHFVVLRACGLGGYVRFACRDHFDRLRDQIFAGGFLAFGFGTFAEVDVFCQGARIAVPPLFVPC